MNQGVKQVGRQWCVPENSPELAAEAGLHQHVQILPVLEGLEQPHDEPAVGLLHNLLDNKSGASVKKYRFAKGSRKKNVCLF